jgi:DNA-binding transcriptional ArsR family regulator
MLNKINDKTFKGIVKNEISKIGHALSDPNRIGILDILSQGERNVEQITQVLKSRKAIVSHHLQVLKNAHLVASRKEGRYVYYSMPEPAQNVWHSINSNSQAMSAEIMNAMNSFFEKSHEFKLENYESLISRVFTEEIILVDVRPESEYKSGHFPGAISIPLESLQKEMSNLPKDKKIVAYCRGSLCILAENAVSMLRTNDFEAFRWSEGILEWAENNVHIEIN